MTCDRADEIAPPQPRLSRLAARLLLERAHSELLGPAPDISKVAHPLDIVHAVQSSGPVPGLDSDKTAEQLEREREAWRLLRDEASSFVQAGPSRPELDFLRRRAAPPASRGRLVHGMAASLVGALVLGWMVAGGQPVVAGFAGALLGHGLFVFVSALAWGR